MCLVSFVPYENEGFILSSNRDESPLRALSQIREETINEQKLLFPLDSKGGSWIFASQKDICICLLNGAQEKHKHTPPYRMSRGIMLKHFFTFQNTHAFINEFNFEGIEPFTLIVIEKALLFEIYWNEKKIECNELDFKSHHIWSSAPLYPSEYKEKRQKWFEDDFFALDRPTPEAIREIHLSGGSHDKEYGFIMNRQNRVRTVSFSQIFRMNGYIHFSFESLVEPVSKKIERSFRLDYTV